MNQDGRLGGTLHNGMGGDQRHERPRLGRALYESKWSASSLDEATILS
jgi:hypothetical protein